MLVSDSAHLPLSTNLLNNMPRPKTAPPGGKMGSTGLTEEQSENRPVSAMEADIHMTAPIIKGPDNRYSTYDNRPIRPINQRLAANFPISPGPRMSPPLPKRMSPPPPKPKYSDSKPRKRTSSFSNKRDDMFEDLDNYEEDLADRPPSPGLAVIKAIVAGRKTKQAVHQIGVPIPGGSAKPEGDGSVKSSPIDIPSPRSGHTTPRQSPVTSSKLSPSPGSPQHKMADYSPKRYTTAKRSALMSKNGSAAPNSPKVVISKARAAEVDRGKGHTTHHQKISPKTQSEAAARVTQPSTGQAPASAEGKCQVKVRGPFVQTLCIEKDSYMDPI